MKALFIVTSALKPLTGVFSHQERFAQTLETIESIKRYAPNSLILVADASVNDATEELNVLSSRVNSIISLKDNPQVQELSRTGQQSRSECLILLNVLHILKDEPNLDVDRIFKITGRCVLEESFKLSDYEGLEGKYVIQKKRETWMNPVAFGANYLYNTRLLSFDKSLMDNYRQVLENSFGILGPIDFEHAHYVNLPKDLVVEFDRVHLAGREASTGKWNHD